MRNARVGYVSAEPFDKLRARAGLDPGTGSVAAVWAWDAFVIKSAAPSDKAAVRQPINGILR